MKRRIRDLCRCAVLMFFVFYSVSVYGAARSFTFNAPIVPVAFTADTAGVEIVYDTSEEVDGRIRIFWPKTKPQELTPPQFEFLFVVEPRQRQGYGKPLFLSSHQGKQILKTEEEAGSSQAALVWEGVSFRVKFPAGSPVRVKMVFSASELKKIRETGIETLLVSLETDFPQANFEDSKSKKVTLVELFGLLAAKEKKLSL